MAGLGEYYSVSADHLKKAFIQARDDGADYLVKLGYSSSGMPYGYPGAGFVMEMIDFHEDTLAVSQKTMKEDLRNFVQKHGDARIEAVYDTKEIFAHAALGENQYSMLDIRLKQVKDEIAAERHQAAMNARPLWRKVLGLGPA